ncbi:hypothetical protein IW148_000513 [Coemansia sp. RSA 1199]|nr:hypothetical protein IW148_000513 [Coemansia sp. RSA 1199]
MDEKSVAQPAKATRPSLRTIVITLFATCVLYTSFMLAYGIDQLAVLASALTQSHVECTYVQAPMVILQSTTVQLTWTTACSLTTRVTYTNGTHEQHTRGAVTRTGPLDTWFEYTAEIPVEYQQCIEYKVGGLDADRGLPEVTGRYCHKLAQEMQPHVGVVMGVGDLDMIAQDRDLEWARGIHHILASSDPDIIIDTSCNAHTPRFSRAIGQMNVKAVIVKTRFMYAIDVDTGIGIERSVPVCGLVAQHLRVCAPVSGAVLSSVGSGLRVEAYGIGANMFGSHVTDVDDAAARLPIAERAEL